MPEGCHDGAAPWAANYDASNVMQFPPASGWGQPWDTFGDPAVGNWVDWPGNWGADTGTSVLGQTLGRSPQSPGRQSRFACPGASQGDACTSRARSLSPLSAGAANAVASACGNWFGGMVAMTACSPSQLSLAVHAGAVGRAGTFRILLRHGARRAASVRGVAQALGRPLVAGESARVEGRASRDTELSVRATGSGRFVEARFNSLGLEHGGHGTLRVYARGQGVRLVWTAPNRRAVQPSWLRSTKLPKQAHRPKRAERKQKSAMTTATSHRRPSASALRGKRQAHRGCSPAAILSWMRKMTEWRHKMQTHTWRGAPPHRIATPNC
jgi:hypothetical protein